MINYLLERPDHTLLCDLDPFDSSASDGDELVWLRRLVHPEWHLERFLLKIQLALIILEEDGRR